MARRRSHSRQSRARGRPKAAETPGRAALGAPVGGPRPWLLSRLTRGAVLLRRVGSKRGITTIVVAVAGFVVALSEFTAALDQVAEQVSRGGTEVWQWARPGPTPTPTPPAELSGALSNVRLGERSVALRTVLRARELPTADFKEWMLPWMGQLITYQVELKGYTGRTLVVRWTLYDAATDERVPSGVWTTVDAAGWPHGKWTPQAGSDRAVGELWVPYPMKGRFYVVIQLLDEEKTVVALATSEAFDAVGPRPGA